MKKLIVVLIMLLLNGCGDYWHVKDFKNREDAITFINNDLLIGAREDCRIFYDCAKNTYVVSYRTNEKN